MAEYISREAAKKTACSLCRWEGTENCEECEHPIDDIPAADVRPVVPKWIPVTEALPDAGERVLCYCRANIYEVMKMRTDGDWVYDTNHIYMHSFVTHWMPLPTPPTAEEGE
jgi:hypothetical protein